MKDIGRPALMKAIFLALVLLAPVLAPGPVVSAEPESSLAFARHLFETGDYDRAITEAKRFIFHRPEDPARVEARLLIARSFRELGQWKAARTSYLEVTANTDRPDLASEAILELGRCLERIDVDLATDYYRKVAAESSWPAEYEADIRNMARYRLGWLMLEAGRWTESKEAFNQIDKGHSLSLSATALSLQAEEGANQEYISPKTAGTLSAILPGAGQLYAGRPVDAALAFGFNSIFLYGTIEAYNNESWAVFALLGLIEVGWYGGNIYNAVNGAHIHNREVKEEFLKKLRKKHAWQLGMVPRKQGAVLSLSFNY